MKLKINLRRGFGSHVKNFLKNFILSQLIITLVLLPILVCWGLEISLAGIIGNLIFAPFLIIFLMLSTLIFFTEFFGVYNIPLVYLLNKFTLFWDALLEQGSKSWLIGFIKPPTILLLPVTILAFIAIKHPSVKTFIQKFLVLSFCLILMVLFLNCWPVKKENFFTFNDKLLISKNPDGKITIIDKGFFNKTKTIEKAAEFEVKPFLVQNLGTTKIDNLIIQKTSGKSFNGAKQFCKILNVKKVTLPFFTDKLNTQGWRLFFELRRFLSENKIGFER